MTRPLRPSPPTTRAATNGVDAVIFDLGVVLLHLDWERGAQRISARTNRTVPELMGWSQRSRWTRDLALGTISRREFLGGVVQELGFRGTQREFAAMWSDMFDANVPMLALAASLKGRVPRVILSNTNAIHMEHVFRAFPAVYDFDGHVFSHEIGLEKPDPRIYQYTLRRHRLTAPRTAFIDDTPANVEAAAAGGLRAIHYQSYDQTRAELASLGLAVG